MKPTPGLSLRRQLLLWLLAPQLFLWLMGGVLAYRVALIYAEKAIDASLSQSVLSLSRQVKPLGSGLLVDFPKAAQAIMEQDPTDRVTYMVSSPPGSFFLGNLKLPPPPEELAVPDNTPVFWNFGWDLTAMLRAAGFTTTALVTAEFARVLRSEAPLPAPDGDIFDVADMVRHARPGDLTVVATDRQAAAMGWLPAQQFVTWECVRR